MRRVIALVAAVVFASIGTFLLVRYVQGAEDRALEGIETVDVLVVASPIPSGTPFADVPTRLVVESIPRKAVAIDAFSDFDDLVGLVAAIDLMPGEQIIAARVLTLEDYQATQEEERQIVVPQNLLEVTFSLNPERILGGVIEPGDVVAILASFDPFNLNTLEPTGLDPAEIPVIVATTVPDQSAAQEPTTTPIATKILLFDVLVTNVQIEQLPRQIDEETSASIPSNTPDLAPTGNLLVTLGLEPIEAEKVVFSVEHGRIWLALQGLEVDVTQSEIQTRVNVYEPE